MKTFRSLRIATAAALIALFGCSKSTPAMQPGTFDKAGSKLEVVSGDGQSGTVGMPLAEPLVVKAIDRNGRPIAGVAITFSSDSGEGDFGGSAINTGMDGTASVVVTLGHKAGADRITASALMLGNSDASFSVTVGPGPAVTLAKVSGDGQVGAAGAPLPQPLTVNAQDAFGNGVSGVAVTWTVGGGDGTVGAQAAVSSDDGTASATATLGMVALDNSYVASAEKLAPVTFAARRKAFKLVYADPPARGKLRLQKNGASTDSTVVLDFVVAAGGDLTGYATGFNLPLDDSKVQLNPAEPMTPGKTLNPGTSPVAARAALGSGPLKGVLVSAQSQKASGEGAVATNTTLPAGTVLYTLRLDLVPTGAPGVVFDGTAAKFVLASGGLRDFAGNTVVDAADIAIGKLEVVK